MKSFREWLNLQEEWYRQDESWVRNAWDALRTPDLPMPFIYNYVQRLARNHTDMSAWKAFLFGLRRLGRKQEAEILGNAINKGTVEVEPVRPSNYDPRMGNVFDKIKFYLHLPSHLAQSQILGFTPAGNGVHEFEMEDPAKRKYTWAN